MSEVEQQESRKTVVAFIAGLLIGGLLVMVFGGGDKNHDDQMMDDNKGEQTEMTDSDTMEESMDDESDDAMASDDEGEAMMKTGTGAVDVSDQPAGSFVNLDSVTFPNDEGWIGVRDYTNGQLTGLLGVARFSKEQGLIPDQVPVVRATEAGREYAVVFYTESGDREFNLANDVLVEGTWARFTAQ